MLHRGPGQSGQHRWMQDLTFSNGGRRLARPTGGGVIEITISVRLVQKAVEITKVVARMGDEPWGLYAQARQATPQTGNHSQLRWEFTRMGTEVTDPKFVAERPIESAARFGRGARPAQGCLDRR